MEKHSLEVEIFSFGYKYGSPLDCNLVIDVRLMANPYWVEKLRPKTGLDPEVAEYVLSSPPAGQLLERITALLELMIKQSLEAGKEQLRVAIGCTGGRHRSVAVCEKLSLTLAGEGVEPQVSHRDIEKDG